MARWYRLFTQILSCLALTLLSITVVTPHWIWVIGPHLNFTMGLWSICANNHCTHLVVDSGENLPPSLSLSRYCIWASLLTLESMGLKKCILLKYFGFSKGRDTPSPLSIPELWDNR